MAAAPPAGDATLAVVGTNHRMSPLELRERLAPHEAELPSVLERLRHAGLAEAVLLSTCDRIEVITLSAAPAQAASVAAEVLAARAALPGERVAAVFYAHEGEAALRHLFAVASALDSLVLGEPHVLGQVKAAHRLAAAIGMVGPELERVFQAAYGAAKRVRSETQVAEQPVSIAAAVLQVARDVHGDLAGCAGLLVGPSEMGEMVAEQLCRAGLGRLMVSGPTARAAASARRFGCNEAPFERLDDALVDADIVVSAVGSGRVLLAPPRVEAALKRRRRKPVLLVDAAIPPDIDPAANGIDGAFVYDLDDLERAAMQGRAGREAAARDAWRIVDAEVAAFRERRAERAAVPAIVALREHFERVRAAVVAEANDRDPEAVTRLLVNRLLHGPSEALRRAALEEEGPDGATLEAMLRRLFRLDRGADEERDE